MTQTGKHPKPHYTVVFDLDGTLCEQTWNGNYDKAKPIPHMIEHLNSLKRRGAYIVINTARGMKTYDRDVETIEKVYRQMTENWLVEHGVMFDELHFGKPAADLYIDDKALNVRDV